MATSIFDDKQNPPTTQDVLQVLGSTAPLWEKLNEYISVLWPQASNEWKFYSKKAGWTLVYKNNKRTMCYFIPKTGFFTISFTLSDKAATAAESAPLPPQVILSIQQATRYVEGRGCTVDVKEYGDLATIQTLLGVKMES